LTQDGAGTVDRDVVQWIELSTEEDFCRELRLSDLKNVNLPVDDPHLGAAVPDLVSHTISPRPVRTLRVQEAHRRPSATPQSTRPGRARSASLRSCSGPASTFLPARLSARANVTASRAALAVAPAVCGRTTNAASAKKAHAAEHRARRFDVDDCL
jgi:hypothetical protein